MLENNTGKKIIFKDFDESISEDEICKLIVQPNQIFEGFIRFTIGNDYFRHTIDIDKKDTKKLILFLEEIIELI